MPRLLLLSSLFLCATTLCGARAGHAREDRRKEAPPTYHGRISRVFQRHCQSCHRPGEAGPFSLLTYRDAVGMKSMIKRVVGDGVMPPWFANPAYGAWTEENRLSDPDRQALLDWIAAGCPEGEPADAPPPLAFPKGWQIGEPDLVVALPKPLDVPAEGILPYEYQRVVVPIDRDRWVRAVEIRPTVREAVHHVLTWLEYPEGHPLAGQEERGYFAGYVPGNGHFIFPPGTAKLLPKGTVIKFQLHYVPMGEPVTDQTQLGLVFQEQPPSRELRTDWAQNPDLAIPPGAPNHAEVGRYTFREAGTLLGFMPHMHVRGKAFRYELVHEDGRAEILLDIPEYDFNWQLTYTLQTPIDVRPGMEIRATGWFDNSPENLANPDARATVRWGEQTSDEMLAGYIHWSRPLRSAPTSTWQAVLLPLSGAGFLLVGSLFFLCVRRIRRTSMNSDEKTRSPQNGG